MDQDGSRGGIQTGALILQKHDTVPVGFCKYQSMGIMKTILCILIFVIGASVCDAETNDLSSLLQRGLLDEEAAHDFNAAIADYQSIAARFDKDREVTATAIYRLGECYRKLGRTNDAFLAYRRVIQEFPDENVLANMSRQNLAEVDHPPSVSASVFQKFTRLNTLLASLRKKADSMLEWTTTNNPAYQSVHNLIGATESEMNKMAIEYPGLVANTSANANSPRTQSDSSQPSSLQKPDLKQQLDFVENLQGMFLTNVIQIAPTLLNDATLNNLIDQYNQCDLKLLRLRVDFGEDHPEIVKTKVLQAGLADRIRERLHGIRTALSMEIRAADKTQSVTFDSETRNATDETEGQEIQRIKEMIRNSPDIALAPNTLGTDAAAGHVRAVELLLANGADVNARDDSGYTALHRAAESAQNAVVTVLLNNKANVDARDGSLRTPLLDAAMNGYKAVAETLLAHNAQVNVVDRYGESPLSFAGSRDKAVMVELLLKAGADPNLGTPPALFGVLRDTNLLVELLGAGAKVDIIQTNTGNPFRIRRESPSHAPPGIGMPFGIRTEIWTETPLDAAASGNRADAVEILLQHGANPNLTNNLGETAFHFAALRPADEKVFKLLLDAKADPNVRDDSGKTALDLVKTTRDPEKLIAWLENHGAK
jgi:ankyrin repeat protein